MNSVKVTGGVEEEDAACLFKQRGVGSGQDRQSGQLGEGNMTIIAAIHSTCRCYLISKICIGEGSSPVQCLCRTTSHGPT